MPLTFEALPSLQIGCHFRFPPGATPENLTALRRFAIALIKRREKSVAATIRKLRMNSRLLLDYLCMTADTRRPARLRLSAHRSKNQLAGRHPACRIGDLRLLPGSVLQSLFEIALTRF